MHGELTHICIYFGRTVSRDRVAVGTVAIVLVDENLSSYIYIVPSRRQKDDRTIRNFDLL